MSYDVWDTAIGRRLAQCDTEEEALIFVRAMASTYHRDQLDNLSLVVPDGDGERELIGAALLDYADSRAKRREPTWSGGGGIHADTAYEPQPMAATGRDHS